MAGSGGSMSGINCSLMGAFSDATCPAPPVIPQMNAQMCSATAQQQIGMTGQQGYGMGMNNMYGMNGMGMGGMGMNGMGMGGMGGMGMMGGGLQGLVSSSTLAQDKKMLDMTACCLNYKGTQILKMKAMEACINTQMQKIQNAANAMENQILSHEQAADKDVQHMEQDIQAKQAIVQQLTDRTQTINQQLTQMNQLQAQLPALTQKLQAEVQDYQQLNASLPEQMLNEEMTLVSTCMNTPLPGYIADQTTGVSVSPNALAASLAQQTAIVGTNNNIEYNAQQSKQAANIASAITAIEAQITGSAPTNGTVSSKTTGQQDQAEQSFRITSAATLQSSGYIADLNKYHIKDSAGHQMNVGDFIAQNWTRCDALAKNQVNAEASRTTTTIGNIKFQIRNKLQTANADSNAELASVAQVVNEATQTMTTDSHPLDITSCLANQDPQQKVNCMTQLQTQVATVINGSGPTANLDFKTNVPADNLHLSCNNLRGCLGTMTQATRTETADATQIQTLETNRKTAENQNTETFLKQGGAQLSKAGASITTALNEINKIRAAAGMPPVPTTPLASEELQKDENGIYKPGQNGVAVLNRYATTPLPDGLKAVQEGASADVQAENQNQQQLAQVMMQENQIGNLKLFCEQQEKQIMDTIAKSPPGACGEVTTSPTNNGAGPPLGVQAGNALAAASAAQGKSGAINPGISNPGQVCGGANQSPGNSNPKNAETSGRNGNNSGPSSALDGE